MTNSSRPPKKHGRGLYLVALLLLFGGIAYLAVSGVSANAVYHLQVAEALALQPEQPVAVAIAGEVAAEGYLLLPPAASSMPSEQGELSKLGGAKFRIKDHLEPGKSLEAIYYGDLPELFAPGAPVILEGVYQGQNEIFQVLKLNTLCPSKYEEKLEDAKMKQTPV